MQHITALAALLPLVAAHGFVNSPAPREPGDAYKAACGDQPYYQQSSDINGNVQGIYQVVGDNFDSANCNLWLCKGFLLEDNPDNLQTYSLGETIEFDVNIAAPHTGYANVSVVKTSSNTIIGEPLIEFSNYAANAGVAANNSAFSVTLPETLGGDCTTAGDCVLQWFWDAPDIDQTYESCVDFVVGAGSGSGSSPSAVVSESAAPVETSVPEETEAATRTAVDVVTSAIEPQVPGATDAAETTAAAETTEAPVADEDEEPIADEDEVCDEEGDDEYDDEEPIADEDEECDEEEDDATEPIADEDEVCDEEGDDEYDDEYEDDASSGSSPSAAAVSVPASKPTAAANYGNSGSYSAGNSKASTVTSYITVSAETVTVTAPAAACTA